MVDHISIYTEKDLENEKTRESIIDSCTHSFILVQDGNITIDKNSKSFELTKNTLFFTLSNDTCQFTRITKDTIFRLLSFKQELMNEIMFDFSRYNLHKMIMYDKFNPVTSGKCDFEQLWMLVSVLQNTLKKNRSNYFDENISGNIVLAIIHYFTSMVISGNTGLIEQKMSRKEEVAVLFMRLLPDHIKRERSVEFYARTIGLTKRYLSATVKEVTGFSPKEFIDKTITREAKILLHSTQKNIGQIADELCFIDQYHFSKFFKKHTGTSPLEFKNRTS